MPVGEGATTLHSLRFLNAILVTFGLFALATRRDILSGGLNCTIFLAGVGLGAFAGGLSWALDGNPSSSAQVFLAVEVVTFVFVWLNARQAMAKP